MLSTAKASALIGELRTLVEIISLRARQAWKQLDALPDLDHSGRMPFSPISSFKMKREPLACRGRRESTTF